MKFIKKKKIVASVYLYDVCEYIDAMVYNNSPGRSKSLFT